MCTWKVSPEILLCGSLVTPFFTDMHKSDNGCKLLLESTAAALNEEALEMLLVTTQHSNMMICIRYAVER